MVSAGRCHTVLLQSDGTAVACGSNAFGQCNIPPLDVGVTYTQVSAGRSHTILLRSDGQVVACGNNDLQQCNVPPLDPGISYTQVSAGECHTVLLRSDGRAVACGSNDCGQCNIPKTLDGQPIGPITQVSCGVDRTLILTFLGRVLVLGERCESNRFEGSFWGQVSYTQISTAGQRAILLRSTAEAVVLSFVDGYGNLFAQRWEDDFSFTQVSAGLHHLLFLRSDGTVFAYGRNDFLQCDIPPLDPGVVYTQVSAGDFHSVLLRSDGQVVACGRNDYGQCNIPTPEEGKCYVPDLTSWCGDIVVQAEFVADPETDAVVLKTTGLGGQPILDLKLTGSMDLHLQDLYRCIAEKLRVNVHRLQVVLDGQLLDNAAEPVDRLCHTIGARSYLMGLYRRAQKTLEKGQAMFWRPWRCVQNKVKHDSGHATWFRRDKTSINRYRMVYYII